MSPGPWPWMPGVPAAGHVTSGGHWHPGAISTCARCNPPEPRKPVKP